MKHHSYSEKENITISELAVQELNEVKEMDPEFSMEDLVEWVNNAVDRFYPKANETADKRVSNTFTVRTLRHYQTLSCLDTPQKNGRRAIYGYRHYLQALLIRKLLYLRYSPDQIRETLNAQSNSAYKEMLFADINIAPRARKLPSHTNDYPKIQPWTRILLSPDAELHLSTPPHLLSQEKQQQLFEKIKEALQLQ